ncbi:zinc finger protein 511 [Impatiens glandulifera]|uniref:zinc finger protein 511 n=1 Tax=Impatiens glandulifera TaxID=253017 RepID=UPI001FB05442|nr:zinc finger protein 511 [Impatiens glandulifera]
MEMKMEVENPTTPQLGFPFWTSLPRRFLPDALFFEPGNLERELLAKQIALDITDDEKQQIENIENEITREVFCPIVNCGAHLKSLESFEDHYNARHAASCSVCSRVYPTSRLLSIHVSEVHDSFFQAKVARGFPMYECLVEGCSMKMKSYKSRQQHLMDKHRFPSTFEFYKKAHTSKKQRKKKLQHKQIRSSDAMQIEEEVEEDDDSSSIDGLVSAVSRLTVDKDPSSISFGRRHTRGLAFVPRSVQRERK